MRDKKLEHARRVRQGLARKQADRQMEIQILADARTKADPVAVIGAAGFWLEHWRGTRHPALNFSAQDWQMSA